jgi:hypothetical protein
MRMLQRSLVVAALAVAGAVFGVPAVASAAPGDEAGYDVSYPQCDTDLPRERTFVVVGVNGGVSTRPNPCLIEQLAWATLASGEVEGQPSAQLYVNTANPGELRHLVDTWPTRGHTPYGVCDGGNSAACSWQYGWERAQQSVVEYFIPAAGAVLVDDEPANYTWWLDVETENTWQYGSAEARGRNLATLEGMAAYLRYRGAEVGIYSTHQQFGEIVGRVGPASDLAGLDSWLAGAGSAEAAAEDCELPPLTPGGEVTLVQYVREFDRNVACG